MTPHVTNIDYLSRSIDPQTGFIYTERLITCRQNVPEFFAKLFGGHSTSMVLERSVVDPVAKKLVLKSKNVTLSHIMTVEETCTYDQLDESQTRFRQEATITAQSGWSYIREALEEFSVNRFQTNAARGRAALEQVLQDLRQDQRALLTQKFGDSELVNEIVGIDEALMMAQEGIVEPE